MKKVRLSEVKLDNDTIGFIFYHANSIKNEPYIAEMKARIENGDVEVNLIKEWDRISEEYRKWPQYPPIGKLFWILVNYFFGKPERLKYLIEHNIETQPIGSVFLNSVRSHEAIIAYMLDNSLLDYDSFKDEIEILKIGFPDNKVVKFSERAINKYVKNRSESPPPLHFTWKFTDTALNKVYDGLANGVYLKKDINKEAFEYVFCGKGVPENFTPLDWLPDSVALLAYMIENLFSVSDSSRKWEITHHCFRVKGKKPNKKTLTKAISDIQVKSKEKPKGHEAIDKITMI